MMMRLGALLAVALTLAFMAGVAAYQIDAMLHGLHPTVIEVHH